MIPGRKQTLLMSSSAVPFHIKMSLLWKPPVWLHRNLCLPQRSESVPPLQTRDHKRVCWGVEFAGKQRRRLDDPWQVSWPIYTALLDITACEQKPQDLAAFVPSSVSIHIKQVTRFSWGHLGGIFAPQAFRSHMISTIARVGFYVGFWIYDGREVFILFVSALQSIERLL